MSRQDLVDLLRRGLIGLAPGPGAGMPGLAVSGGGDSLALMHLCAAAGIMARVATVDHGLRAEAASEAAMVARQARALGFAQDTLIWDGSAATGNLALAARQARRRLLAGWARRRGLSGVVLAHTQDDLAETFLMRLARGAGVDGLSAMAPVYTLDGVAFLRPLLAVSRADLRDWLRARGVTWAEDPTNSDDRYDRARARKVLAALAPLGLGAGRLAEVAGHLAQARAALEATTAALLHRSVTVAGQGLALRLDAGALSAAPEDIRRRALVAIVLWLAPAPYAPRGAQVAALAARLGSGQHSQLGGARFAFRKDGLWAWAERFGPWTTSVTGLRLAPLGAEGLAQCPDWRASGLPRPVLLTAPALWQGDALAFCPLAGRPGGPAMDRSGPAHPAFARILSH